ncbi:MAG: Hpt domain-containing protein, partial [Blastocatellia bacterium]
MNHLLKKIRQDLHGLRPDDQTALIQIGAALQQFVSEVAPEAALASDLLMLCLSGLQSIYQQTCTDFAALREAINSATVAVEQVLSMPESPLTHMIAEDAREVLQQALGLTPPPAAESADVAVTALPAENVAAAPPPMLPSIQTLDDASAFFMQMGAEDRPALAHLRDALKAMAMGDSLTPEIKKLVIKAGKATEQLLLHRAENAQATFDEIGRWLNEAALAHDFAAHGGQPTPAPASSVPPLPPIPAPPVAAAPAVTAPVAVSDTAADFGLLPPDTDTALVGEFIIESGEYLEGAEAALLALESDPDNLEAVNTVFRAFHTIKGTSAFLGLDKISTLAHRAESLLSRVRDREIRCTGGYADLAL